MEFGEKNYDYLVELLENLRHPEHGLLSKLKS